MTLEELQILITAETSSLKKSLADVKSQLGNTEKEVKKSTGRIGTMIKRLGVLFAGIFAVKQIVDFGRQSVQAFSDVTVEVAKLERVMKNTMGATDAQVQSIQDLAAAQEQIGVIEADVQIAGAQELGTYLSDVRSLQTLLPTLNDMLAQQYGMEATSGAAVNIGGMIGKVMEGQLGALSRYGYSWDEAQEKVLKHGNELERAAMLAEVIGQSVGGMNEQLARTPIGMMRQLAFTFGAIKEELGRGLMPVLQRVLPYLQAMAQWLLRVTQYVSAFMQALFGGSSQGTSSISAQAGAVSDLGDAYEEAGKKAQKSVGGFDQLNLVGAKSGGGGEDAGASGIGGAIGAGDLGPLNDVSDSMSKITESAQKAADRVKAMAETIKNAYGTMATFLKENSDIIIAALAGVGTAIAVYFAVAKWPAIASAISSAIGVIKTAFMGVAAVIGGISAVALIVAAVIGGLVAAFVYFYRTNEEFRDTVHTILARIGEVALWLWNEVLVPLGAWLGSVLVAAWHAAGEAAKWLWDNVLVPFGAWLLDVMPKAWDAVVKAAEWLWKNVLVPLGDFLKWLWDNVLVPVGNVLIDVLAVAFETVADIAKEFWKNVLVPLGQALAEMFGPAVEAVSAVLQFLWNNVLVPLGKMIKTFIMPIIKGLIDVFEWLWKNVLKPLVSFVADVLVTVFRNAFDSIGGIIGGVKDIFVGLMKFITGIFTGDWEKAWEGVKQIFKGVFDTLWNIVKFPLNLIIDGINALIGGINNISLDIPEWVPKFGGQSFGISIPKIPKLAVGTNYVAKDGLAFLHEGEAVVPKKFNPAAGGTGTGSIDTREMVGVLKNILQAVKSGTNVEVVMSRSEIGGAAVDYIRGEQRRTGRAPFSV